MNSMYSNEIARFMQINNEIIERIRKLCELHKVESLYLFGSALKDNLKEDSDYDFVVSFKNMELESYPDNYFNLKFALHDILNRDIDLLENQAIKNPYLIKSIERSKVLIYG